MTTQRDWVAELKGYQAEVEPKTGYIGIPKWLDADRRAIVERVYSVPQRAVDAYRSTKRREAQR